MGIDAVDDWRTPEQGLEWDLLLMQSLFRRIIKQYAIVRQEKLTFLPRQQKATQMAVVEDNQIIDVVPSSSTPSHTNGHTFSNPDTTLYAFDPNQLVTKADVLIHLKTTDHLLEKRRFLRVLYTNLACCSHAKELVSINHYVKYRLHERTISYQMIQDRLLHIYKNYKEQLAFKQRLEDFKESAAKISPWCIRDRKSICKSPSQYYNVHILPSRPKTQQQLEQEAEMIKQHAKVLVYTTIHLVVSQMVDAVQPQSQPSTIAHGSTSQETGTSSVASHHASRTVVKARVHLKHDQEHAEATRKRLRLQILVPGLFQTHTKSNFGNLTDNSPQARPTSKRQEELLALVEANGDVRIAEQLLHQTIPQSGFHRVVQHLDNLATIESSREAWSTIKLWKTVYRNHTIQAIQRLDPTR